MEQPIVTQPGSDFQSLPLQGANDDCSLTAAGGHGTALMQEQPLISIDLAADDPRSQYVHHLAPGRPLINTMKLPEKLEILLHFYFHSGFNRFLQITLNGNYKHTYFICQKWVHLIGERYLSL